ncbi:lysine N(6)-hydroxylase/L-ornithine N(5)-oxygenase family protein [uncultured Bradyrhizobium sp.]|uniref:lysine N(6)-hydroxylase/L-ornithine N(5)-oxygenase family protein n=1 Tax=uncultured Bradyrhizobium sp. TaxID=199684 RepID=UPI0035CB495B
MKTQIVGIGVGPANLSFASLLHPTGRSNYFFEKKKEFSWHPGLQIPNASLQVSFLKDLVTLADPTNPFSFLAYLHEHGRTYQFLNARFDAVTREEFTLYFKWAARRNANVHFDEEVVGIDFKDDFIVRTNRRELRSENLSIGVGKVPSVPEFAAQKLGPTMFHSADYMRHIGRFGGKRVAVVGSGQSGAEIFQNLISQEGDATPSHVAWISRRACFWPLDDSPFTNDLFMPCHQRYFSSLSETTRRRFLNDNVLASDGISELTLRDIYRRLYLQRFVTGKDSSIDMLPARTVTHLIGEGSSWVLRLSHDDVNVHETMKFDVVIWATGYRNAPVHFLDSFANRLHRVGDEIAIDDSFAAQWDGPRNRSIFIQNASRSQKGLADPNLSLLAWRSEKMLERLTGLPSRVEPLPSVMSWAPVSPLPHQSGMGRVGMP